MKTTVTMTLVVEVERTDGRAFRRGRQELAEFLFDALDRHCRSRYLPIKDADHAVTVRGLSVNPATAP